MPNEKTNRAAHLLAENVMQLMKSESYKAALKLRKQMSHYSFRNVYLIWLQCPFASYIAGYQQWVRRAKRIV